MVNKACNTYAHRFMRPSPQNVPRANLIGQGTTHLVCQAAVAVPTHQAGHVPPLPSSRNYAPAITKNAEQIHSHWLAAAAALVQAGVCTGATTGNELLPPETHLTHAWPHFADLFVLALSSHTPTDSTRLLHNAPQPTGVMLLSPDDVCLQEEVQHRGAHGWCVQQAGVGWPRRVPELVGWLLPPASPSPAAAA